MHPEKSTVPRREVGGGRARDPARGSTVPRLLRGYEFVGLVGKSMLGRAGG